LQDFASALDRPGGLRAHAEMLLVRAGRDIWHGKRNSFILNV